MAFKEVEYDSVVVSTTGVIVPTCNVCLRYANGTSKRSIIGIGDTIAVKFIKYENLSTSYGRVSDLKADYLVIDDSENFSSSKKKIYYSSIRDITNISSPDKDMMFDRFNLPISKPSEEKTDEEVNDNVIANITNKMDTIINSIQIMNNDVSTLKQSLADLSEEVHNPLQLENPDNTGDNTNTDSTDENENQMDN